MSDIVIMFRAFLRHIISQKEMMHLDIIWRSYERVLRVVSEIENNVNYGRHLCREKYIHTCSFEGKLVHNVKKTIPR